MVDPPSAADIIARLKLKPHPEGGHYRETFRDARLDANGRSLSTAIHFLLARGGRSVRLGADLAAGEVPQAVVPVKAWQAAESTGDWTLAGCTVAPGFDFATFEIAPKNWTPDR